MSLCTFSRESASFVYAFDDLVARQVQPARWQNNLNLDISWSGRCIDSLISSSYLQCFGYLLFYHLFFADSCFILFFVDENLSSCGWHLAYHPRVYFPTVLQLSHNRTTKILVWNIRGINKQEKWHDIQVKITESAYQIFVCRKQREVLLIIFIWRNFVLDN